MSQGFQQEFLSYVERSGKDVDLRSAVSGVGDQCVDYPSSTDTDDLVRQLTSSMKEKMCDEEDVSEGVQLRSMVGMMKRLKRRASLGSTEDLDEDEEACRASCNPDTLLAGRPKRNIITKNLDFTAGLSWKEENDLKKALYASLQENKKRETESPGGPLAKQVTSMSMDSLNKRSWTPRTMDDSSQDSLLENPSEKEYVKTNPLYRARVHAQRKFAQGSRPNSPNVSPMKPKPSPKKFFTTKKAKTEDFLTFLCLRGSHLLPPHMDFYNMEDSDETNGSSAPGTPRQYSSRPGTPGLLGRVVSCGPVSRNSSPDRDIASFSHELGVRPLVYVHRQRGRPKKNVSWSPIVDKTKGGEQNTVACSVDVAHCSKTADYNCPDIQQYGTSCLENGKIEKCDSQEIGGIEKSSFLEISEIEKLCSMKICETEKSSSIEKCGTEKSSSFEICESEKSSSIEIYGIEKSSSADICETEKSSSMGICETEESCSIKSCETEKSSTKDVAKTEQSSYVAVRSMQCVEVDVIKKRVLADIAKIENANRGICYMEDMKKSCRRKIDFKKSSAAGQKKRSKTEIIQAEVSSDIPSAHAVETIAMQYNFMAEDFERNPLPSQLRPRGRPRKPKIELQRVTAKHVKGRTKKSGFLQVKNHCHPAAVAHANQQIPYENFVKREPGNVQKVSVKHTKFRTNKSKSLQVKNDWQVAAVAHAQQHVKSEDIVKGKPGYLQQVTVKHPIGRLQKLREKIEAKTAGLQGHPKPQKYGPQKVAKIKVKNWTSSGKGDIRSGEASVKGIDSNKSSTGNTSSNTGLAHVNSFAQPKRLVDCNLIYWEAEHKGIIQIDGTHDGKCDDKTYSTDGTSSVSFMKVNSDSITTPHKMADQVVPSTMPGHSVMQDSTANKETQESVTQNINCFVAARAALFTQDKTPATPDTRGSVAQNENCFVAPSAAALTGESLTVRHPHLVKILNGIDNTKTMANSVVTDSLSMQDWSVKDTGSYQSGTAHQTGHATCYTDGPDIQEFLDTVSAIHQEQLNAVDDEISKFLKASQCMNSIKGYDVDENIDVNDPGRDQKSGGHAVDGYNSSSYNTSYLNGKVGDLKQGFSGCDQFLENTDNFQFIRTSQDTNVHYESCHEVAAFAECVSERLSEDAFTLLNHDPEETLSAEEIISSDEDSLAEVSLTDGKKEAVYYKHLKMFRDFPLSHKCVMPEEQQSYMMRNAEFGQLSPELKYHCENSLPDVSNSPSENVALFDELQIIHSEVASVQGDQNMEALLMRQENSSEDILQQAMFEILNDTSQQEQMASGSEYKKCVNDTGDKESKDIDAFPVQQDQSDGQTLRNLVTNYDNTKLLLQSPKNTLTSSFNQADDSCTKPKHGLPPISEILPHTWREHMTNTLSQLNTLTQPYRQACDSHATCNVDTETNHPKPTSSSRDRSSTITKFSFNSPTSSKHDVTMALHAPNLGLSHSDGGYRSASSPKLYPAQEKQQVFHDPVRDNAVCCSAYQRQRPDSLAYSSSSVYQMAVPEHLTLDQNCAQKTDSTRKSLWKPPTALMTMQVGSPQETFCRPTEEVLAVPLVKAKCHPFAVPTTVIMGPFQPTSTLPSIAASGYVLVPKTVAQQRHVLPLVQSQAYGGAEYEGPTHHHESAMKRDYIGCEGQRERKRFKYSGASSAFKPSVCAQSAATLKRFKDSSHLRMPQHAGDPEAQPLQPLQHRTILPEERHIHISQQEIPSVRQIVEETSSTIPNPQKLTNDVLKAKSLTPICLHPVDSSAMNALGSHAKSGQPIGSCAKNAQPVGPHVINAQLIGANLKYAQRIPTYSMSEQPVPADGLNAQPIGHRAMNAQMIFSHARDSQTNSHSAQNVKPNPQPALHNHSGRPPNLKMLGTRQSRESIPAMYCNLPNLEMSANSYLATSFPIKKMSPWKWDTILGSTYEPQAEAHKPRSGVKIIIKDLGARQMSSEDSTSVLDDSKYHGPESNASIIVDAAEKIFLANTAEEQFVPNAVQEVEVTTEDDETAMLDYPDIFMVETSANIDSFLNEVSQVARVTPPNTQKKSIAEMPAKAQNSISEEGTILPDVDVLENRVADTLPHNQNHLSQDSLNIKVQAENVISQSQKIDKGSYEGNTSNGPARKTLNSILGAESNIDKSTPECSEFSVPKIAKPEPEHPVMHRDGHNRSGRKRKFIVAFEKRETRSGTRKTRQSSARAKEIACKYLGYVKNTSKAKVLFSNSDTRGRRKCHASQGSIMTEDLNFKKRSQQCNSLSEKTKTKSLSPKTKAEGLSPKTKAKGISPKAKTNALSPQIETKGVFKQTNTKTLLSKAKTKALLAKTETKRLASKTETKGILPKTKSKALSAKTENKALLAKTKTETKGFSPNTRTKVLSAKAKTKALLEKTKTKALSAKTETKGLLPKTKTKTLLAKTKTKALSAKTKTKALSAKTKTKALSAKTKTKALSAKTETKGPSPKAKTKALSAKSETKALFAKSESKALSAKTKTKGLSPKTKTKALSANSETKALLAKNETKDLSAKTEVKGLAPKIETRGIFPKTKSKAHSPKTKSKAILPKTKIKCLSQKTKISGLSPKAKIKNLFPETIANDLSPKTKSNGPTLEPKSNGPSPKFQPKSLFPKSCTRGLSNSTKDRSSNANTIHGPQRSTNYDTPRKIKAKDQSSEIKTKVVITEDKNISLTSDAKVNPRWNSKVNFSKLKAKVILQSHDKLTCYQTKVMLEDIALPSETKGKVMVANPEVMLMSAIAPSGFYSQKCKPPDDMKRRKDGSLTPVIPLKRLKQPDSASSSPSKQESKGDKKSKSKHELLVRKHLVMKRDASKEKGLYLIRHAKNMVNRADKKKKQILTRSAAAAAIRAKREADEHRKAVKAASKDKDTPKSPSTPKSPPVRSPLTPKSSRLEKPLCKTTDMKKDKESKKLDKPTSSSLASDMALRKRPGRPRKDILKVKLPITKKTPKKDSPVKVEPRETRQHRRSRSAPVHYAEWDDDDHEISFKDIGFLSSDDEYEDTKSVKSVASIRSSISVKSGISISSASKSSAKVDSAITTRHAAKTLAKLTPEAKKKPQEATPDVKRKPESTPEVKKKPEQTPETKRKPDSTPETKKKPIDLITPEPKKKPDVTVETKKKAEQTPEAKKKAENTPDPKKKPIDLTTPEPKKKPFDLATPEPKKRPIDLTTPEPKKKPDQTPDAKPKVIDLVTPEAKKKPSDTTAPMPKKKPELTPEAKKKPPDRASAMTPPPIKPRDTASPKPNTPVIGKFRELLTARKTACITPPPAAGKSPKPLAKPASPVFIKQEPGTSKPRTRTISETSNAALKGLAEPIPRVSSPTPVLRATLRETFPNPTDKARIVNVPTYHPSAESFNDPVLYIDTIRMDAEPFGMCRIIPPDGWKPECRINDDLKFFTHVQYIHRMQNRWGSNSVEMECIRRHLESQGVKLEPPIVGGVELDVAFLLETVQKLGGVQYIVNKNKWAKVADILKIPRGAQERHSRLYDIYCKFLLSYDTMDEDAKTKLLQQVQAHVARNADKVDCVCKGRRRSRQLGEFFKLSRNLQSMWFKDDPTAKQVETEYWKIVREAKYHVSVQGAQVDTKVCGSGFPTKKDCPSNISPYSRHGWNFNILQHNNASVLKNLGQISGVTCSTLHISMLFTTSCWSRDQHRLPYIVYNYTGADIIWYSIPGSEEEKFYNALKVLTPSLIENGKLWLPDDSVMVSPEQLVEYGVSVGQVVLRQGEFLIVFPGTFTSSVSCGYNISESLHFATARWLPHGIRAAKECFDSFTPEKFSIERLLFRMAYNEKTPGETLHYLLPHLEQIIKEEIRQRNTLAEAGLKTTKRMVCADTLNAKRARQAADTSDEENVCDVSGKICYLSMVVNEAEDTTYSLAHGLTHIQRRKNLKNCHLSYRFSEDEMGSLLDHIRQRLANASPAKKKHKVLAKSTVPTS